MYVHFPTYVQKYFEKIIVTCYRSHSTQLAGIYLGHFYSIYGYLFTAVRQPSLLLK